ncbi:MAG: ABC transporter permease [Acidobacteria bacterium]|nr:ABC transporter permease [Acidobacteriota bacterium]
MFADLQRDVLYGLRMLRKSPGFTTVAVLTLALGIGANTAIFSVVNAVLLRPLPFDHPDRIVTLGEKTKDGNRMNVGYTTYVDWQTESRTFEHLAAYRWWDPSLTGEGPPERLSGLRASQSFFSALGVHPALGRDFLPEEDRYSFSRRRLESQISSLFVGRIAESMIFGKDAMTTGAANDIERATALARNMVTKWGLSDGMGPLTYSEDDGEIFLGRSVTQHKHVSDETAHAIDREIRMLIDRNYARAEKILQKATKTLHKMAEALIKYETIDEDQIKDIMAGRKPSPPADWEDSDTKGSAKDKKGRKKAKGKIGGPAEQL